MVNQQSTRRVGPPGSRLLDRFGAVLLLVLATICAQSLIDVRGSAVGSLVTHAISGLALVVAVRAGGVSRRWTRVADLIVVVTLVFSVTVTVLALSVDKAGLELRGDLAWVLAACLVPVAVARRLVSHTRVTLQTVIGAVAAYLQIAVAFASVFQFLDVVSSEPFFGTSVSTTQYMYVSLQTVSTLGYGDLTSATDLGRLMTVSEGIVGQVFLVTFVAMIVSRFQGPAADRALPEHQRTHDSDDPPAQA